MAAKFLLCGRCCSSHSPASSEAEPETVPETEAMGETCTPQLAKMADNSLLCGVSFSADPLDPSEAEVEIVPETETEVVAETVTPQEQVFANELLLDKILQFSLYDNGDKFNMKTARTCKLVHSSWMLRVNVALQRAHMPQVRLHTSRNLIKVIKFVKTFTGRLADKMIPFLLTISPEQNGSCFSEMEYTAEILQTSMKSLWQCGSGLVELIIICENALWEGIEDPSVFSPESLHLPHLQKITIQVELRKTQPYIPNGRRSDSALVMKDGIEWLQDEFRNGRDFFGRPSERSVMENLSKGKMQAFVQSILSASSSVKSFSLISHSFDHPDQQPWGINIKCLELPESLKEIRINSSSPTWVLHVDDMFLTKALLPNLTSLSLQIDSLQMMDLTSKVENIIFKLRHQLRKLDISNAEGDADSEIPLRLPVMGSLDEVRCGLWYGAGVSYDFPYFFPVLKKFTCLETSPSSLPRWIGEGGSAGVSLSVVDAHLRFSRDTRGNDTHARNQGVLKKMRDLKTLFPNLNQLKVVFFDFEQELCAMKYIFQHFTQLQVLEVHVQDFIGSSDTFNALLLGINKKEARALRKELSGVNVNYEVESSIVNLRELKKMHLSTPCFGYFNQNRKILYDLDVTVKYGISRMPNLVDFSYSGGLSLKAPQKMAECLTSNQRVYRR